MGSHKWFLGYDDYDSSSITIASYLTQPMTISFKLNITAKVIESIKMGLVLWIIEVILSILKASWAVGL
jgi:hypothetical protein